MLNDLSKALAQLRDPKILKVLVASLIMALVIMGCMIAGIAWALGAWTPSNGGFLGFSIIDTVLGFLLDTIGLTVAGIVAMLLFPAAAIGMQSLFLDSVAEAVEARYYPHLPPARRQRVGEIIWTAFRLMAVVLGLNILLLILWLILLFTLPPLAPFPYYIVNGYLIGREYFELLALRRMDPLEAAVLRKQKLGSNVLDGIVLTLLFTIPIVNLAGPIIAAAYMTHRFHRVWTPSSTATRTNPTSHPKLEGDAFM